MFNFKSFLLIIAGIQHVSGHGYAYSPRTRNWFAVEEGTEGQSVEGLPNKEYCPDCLNTNESGGICGKPNSGASYTTFMDSTGQEMPWISQETYVQGQEIIVKHFYTTHHYGHITLSACPLGKSSTQECFDNPDNWLEFVRDNSHGMPKDVNHPERGYLKRGPMDFEFAFKLPENVVGSEVLIQWRYITANSCIPEGYADYFNWAIAHPDYNVVPSDWKGANMQLCDKYPQDGSKPDGGAPEQFWNCAEVSINSGTPTVPTPTAPIVPPTPGPVNTPAPIQVVPNPSGIPFPCCSWHSDFCEQPNNSWCHASKSNCEGSCSGVYRDPYNQPQPTPTPPNPTMPNPTAPNPTPVPPTDIPTTGVPCCSINLKDCMSWCTDCHTSQETCENYGGNPTFWMPWGEPLDPNSCIAITYSCVGHGKPCCPGMICNPDTSSAPCIVAPTAPVSSPTSAPVSSAPVSYPSPTTTPPPASSPTPPNNSNLFSTDNSLSVWDAFLNIEPLTYVVSNNPPVYALQAEGGAAGNGNVVSESQAYSVLISSIVLTSWDTHSADNSDADWNVALEKFEGYFNGWKRMCLNSSPSNGCQYDGQWCEDESTGESGVCLPGWKHSGDLSAEEGTGSAPDGDEDAILGMIFAIKALEGKPKPSWYDELRKWADASCSAFLKYNTVTKGGYRMLKLGSCWGGWGNDGNNPSYHSPGSFKVMRDFHASFPANERDYALPNFGSGSLEDHWNNLINTSYEAIEATQCPDQGMVPNWSTVDIVGNGIQHTGGTFSGSGTPQWEYGAEAGRTTWRVAIDAALYPNEMNAAAEPYLRPLLTTLNDGFDPNLSPNEKYFKSDTFSSCQLPSVSRSITSFSGGWVWNAFVFAPTVSSLVVPIQGVSETEQQDMIDKTGTVLATSIPTSYYHRCWTVLAIMTLNGAIESTGKLLDSDTTPSPIQPIAPTPSPVVPTSSPISPTLPPQAPPTKVPTSPPVDSEGCNSVNYQNCLPEGYPTEDVCNLVWLPDGERTGCAALWKGCGDSSDCCGEAVCFGDGDSAACVPPSEDDSSDDNCVVCDDVPTTSMENKNKECPDVPNTLNKKCNKNANWTKKGFCKLSCHNTGNGYPNAVCCNGNS